MSLAIINNFRVSGHEQKYLDKNLHLKDQYAGQTRTKWYSVSIQLILQHLRLMFNSWSFCHYF